MGIDAVFLVFVLIFSVGLCSEEPANYRANCIHMTPEKEQQLDAIIEKLSGFLNNLTIEHEHFDVRLIKLAIDQHSDDEEEKETLLQLSVNDCLLNDDQLDDIDHHREKARQRIDAKCTDTGKKVDVMYLDLEENGQKLVEALDKNGKRPRLVYVQKDRGQLDYLFYKKK